MESEKVKEIKKALECCSQGKCEKCRIGRMNIRECVDILLKDTLTLINELESENSKLKQHKRELEGGQRDLLKVIKEFDKENQQLKDRIAELEKENGELKQHVTEVEKGIINIAKERNKKDELASKFIDSYNDCLKQFAERLKNKLFEFFQDNEELDGKISVGPLYVDVIGVEAKDGTIISLGLIDELLKEYVK